jgi:hypothetical protein
MKINSILRFIGASLILAMLVWTLTANLAIAPVQAAIRQLEEAPGQLVWQSRQTLKDEHGGSWQAIAFKRVRPDGSAHIYLRLVGFPGTADLDHSQPLTLTNSLGKTLTAADISSDMFTDKTQIKTDMGQYDLQPILMQLEPAMPLQLTLPTLDQEKISLNVSPTVVEEWRSLTDQK